MMGLNDELATMWKEVVVDLLKVLFQHYVTNASGPRIESRTSGIQRNSINHSTAISIDCSYKKRD
jgi:hypothetical protein